MLLMSLPSAMLELVMEHMRVLELLRMSSTCRELRALRDSAANAAIHRLKACPFAASLGLSSTLSLATAEAYDDAATALAMAPSARRATRSLWEHFDFESADWVQRAGRVTRLPQEVLLAMLRCAHMPGDHGHGHGPGAAYRSMAWVSKRFSRRPILRRSLQLLVCGDQGRLWCSEQDVDSDGTEPTGRFQLHFGRVLRTGVPGFCQELRIEGELCYPVALREARAESKRELREWRAIDSRERHDAKAWRRRHLQSHGGDLPDAYAVATSSTEQMIVHTDELRTLYQNGGVGADHFACPQDGVTMCWRRIRQLPALHEFLDDSIPRRDILPSESEEEEGDDDDDGPDVTYRFEALVAGQQISLGAQHDESAGEDEVESEPGELIYETIEGDLMLCATFCGSNCCGDYEEWLLRLIPPHHM